MKRRAHEAVLLKRLPWPVCKHCGLIYLRNDRTRAAITAGCVVYADERP